MLITGHSFPFLTRGQVEHHLVISFSSKAYLLSIATVISDYHVGNHQFSNDLLLCNITSGTYLSVIEWKKKDITDKSN